MGDSKKIEQPDITSYERDELSTELAFTGNGSIKASDRHVKRHFAAVDADEVLRKSLAVAKEPAVVTFGRAELDVPLARTFLVSGE